MVNLSFKLNGIVYQLSVFDEFILNYFCRLVENVVMNFVGCALAIGKHIKTDATDTMAMRQMCMTRNDGSTTSNGMVFIRSH